MNLNEALFYDIETHRVKSWEERSPALRRAFINHYYDPTSYDNPEEHYNEIAGLHSEFSEVICVSFGYVNPTTNTFVTTSVTQENSDEKEVLKTCASIFEKFQKSGYWLAGHAIQSCDIPYLTKRYILNSMKVPDFINQFGQKPWEKVHLDTMEFWKMGEFRRVSLETICAAIGNISCKTDELGGSNLWEYDINEMDWKQLSHYCEEDVRSNYEMMKHILTYYETE